MTNSTKKTTSSEPASDFHDRFGVELDIVEARRRFVNKVKNRIINYYLSVHTAEHDILWAVADALGEEHDFGLTLGDYIGIDFHKCLCAIEISFTVLQKKDYGGATEIENEIQEILHESETDLGLKWDAGKFVPKGAELLDLELVRKPLRWLKAKRYRSVYEPFQKGLSHFVAASRKPLLLSDVVTDMYEALEALAKIVTDRPTKDLSANAELFIKEIKASAAYKSILKEYVEYANNFRHAIQEGKNKPTLSSSEVESFIYLTGVFIRLAITESKPGSLDGDS